MLAKVKFSLNSNRTYDYETDIRNLKKFDCILVETQYGEGIAFFERYILDEDLAFDGELSKILEKLDLNDDVTLDRIREIKKRCE